MLGTLGLQEYMKKQAQEDVAAVTIKTQALLRTLVSRYAPADAALRCGNASC